MTLKQLFWPHEYATPLGFVRYHTNRCSAGDHCWRKATHPEPEVTLRACDLHVDSPINQIFGSLRAKNAQRKLVDPAYRLEIDWYSEQLAQYRSDKVHSVWWRLTYIWRKDRRPSS